MTLSQRQHDILLATIHEYIRTARAVGSGTLVEACDLALSPASVRTALMELEEQGYLSQPHTSAGRIPTERAYRYFIAHMLNERRVAEDAQDSIRHAFAHGGTYEERLKAVARALADLCENTVIVGFARHDVFYTGLAHLFQQPEFAHLDLVRSISSVVDRMDDVVASLYDRVHAETVIFVGKESPFGEATGALLMKCAPAMSRTARLLGIVGPQRMAYDENAALLQFTRQILTQ